MVRLPDVQLIGAQKAGTSALADFLFDEGGFCRPLVSDGEPSFYSKEVHFFDDEWRYEQGLEFYGKRFRHCGLDCKTMDATPDTLPFAQRVRSTYDAAGGDQTKKAKIIVILREPISRELSLYNHLAHDCRLLSPADRNEWQMQAIRDDGSVMSFDEFVFERSIPALGREAGLGRSTRHGMYAVHMKKWFELFDRQQILVLSYHELRYHPGRLQERIQSFLGHRVIGGGGLQRSNCNESKFKVQHPSARAQDALNEVFAPLNADLYKLLESNRGPEMEETPFPRFVKPEVLHSETANAAD